jgi:curved DNA-binding protein CbpA
MSIGEKRCHYVVLGVEQDASCEEIKRAYRKCALKWYVAFDI